MRKQAASDRTGEQSTKTQQAPERSVWQGVDVGVSWGLWLGLAALFFWAKGLLLEQWDSLSMLLGAALVPSVLVLGYQLLGSRSTLSQRLEAVAQYREYVRHYAEIHTHDKIPLVLSTALGGTPVELNGRGRRLAFSALLLAVPFIWLALLLANPEGARVLERVDPDGLRGLKLSGCGVYTYTLMLTIFRLRTAAISSEFVLAATLRALILMAVGYVPGLTPLVPDSEKGWSAVAFFGLGLFPNLGLRALRQRVKRLLAPAAPGEDTLSMEYVDGITEPVAERLEELGIFDVQHLARVEPGWLSMRTLYPLSRILDWMNQAILISYLRDKIVLARQAGIRGAIDLRALYEEATSAGASRPEAGPQGDPLDPAARARTVLQEVATRAGMPLAALYAIGDSLSHDMLVHFLSCSLGSRCVPEPASHTSKARPPRAQGLTPVAAESA